MGVLVRQQKIAQKSVLILGRFFIRRAYTTKMHFPLSGNAFLFRSQVYQC